MAFDCAHAAGDESRAIRSARTLASEDSLAHKLIVGLSSEVRRDMANMLSGSYAGLAGVGPAAAAGAGGIPQRASQSGAHNAMFSTGGSRASPSVEGQLEMMPPRRKRSGGTLSPAPSRGPSTSQATQLVWPVSGESQAAEGVAGLAAGGSSNGAAASGSAGGGRTHPNPHRSRSQVLLAANVVAAAASRLRRTSSLGQVPNVHQLDGATPSSSMYNGATGGPGSQTGGDGRSSGMGAGTGPIGIPFSGSGGSSKGHGRSTSVSRSRTQADLANPLTPGNSREYGIGSSFTRQSLDLSLLATGGWVEASSCWVISPACSGTAPPWTKVMHELPMRMPCRPGHAGHAMQTMPCMRAVTRASHAEAMPCSAAPSPPL